MLEDYAHHVAPPPPDFRALLPQDVEIRHSMIILQSRGAD
jgi:hypothetical protein